VRLDLRLHELQLRLEDVLLELLALGLRADAGAPRRARASRAGTKPATATQPKPMPRPMVMLTPASRSVNIAPMARPLTRPARMVPRNEPTTTASIWRATGFGHSTRKLPAMVKRTMVV
jgi:hypothetical protein